MTEALEIWTICKHPRDFPDKFTARRHVITNGTQQPTAALLVADDIEPLRQAMLERGLYRMPRAPEDDPVIVESWL